MTLLELFEDDHYRFKMRFERSSIAEFFKPTANHSAITTERRHWLESAPHTYAALLPEGVDLLEETIELARTHQTIDSRLAESLDEPATPWDKCLQLGQEWEPDYLLLRARPGEAFRLLGGCVCFPSSWSLAEKMAHPLEFIHSVVPGLNSDLGNQIHLFLSRMKPGIAWMRTNWGLSRSPEFNQHPERKLPRLDASVSLSEVWLRVEYQALVSLPETPGVLFGIRIAVHPLTELQKDRDLASGLRRALDTMPEDMARYKGLASARRNIIGMLE